MKRCPVIGLMKVGISALICDNKKTTLKFGGWEWLFKSYIVWKKDFPMPKLSRSGFLWKLDKNIQKQFGWEVAGFLAYIDEFEANKKTCFVSRKNMAHDLGLSETKIHRFLQMLTKKGIIKVAHKGRKRIVKL